MLPSYYTSPAAREAEGGTDYTLKKVFSAPKGRGISAMGAAHRDNGTNNLAPKERNQRTISNDKAQISNMVIITQFPPIDLP